MITQPHCCFTEGCSDGAHSKCCDEAVAYRDTIAALRAEAQRHSELALKWAVQADMAADASRDAAMYQERAERAEAALTEAREALSQSYALFSQAIDCAYGDLGMDPGREWAGNADDVRCDIRAFLERTK